MHDLLSIWKWVNYILLFLKKLIFQFINCSINHQSMILETDLSMWAHSFLKVMHMCMCMIMTVIMFFLRLLFINPIVKLLLIIDIMYLIVIISIKFDKSLINLAIVYIWFEWIQFEVISCVYARAAKDCLFLFFEFENTILLGFLIYLIWCGIIIGLLNINIVVSNRLIHCFIQKSLWFLFFVWTQCMLIIIIYIHSKRPLLYWWLSFSVKEFLSHSLIWAIGFDVFVFIRINRYIMISWKLWYHRNGNNFIIWWRQRAHIYWIIIDWFRTLHFYINRFL